MSADRTVLVAVALVVAGLAALTMAWVGVSATVVIPTQVAFAVSGGVGGLALIGAGVAVYEVQRRRITAAEARRDLTRFASELGDIAELVAARRLRPATRRAHRVLRAR
jgi:hypothetical protein